MAVATSLSRRVVALYGALLAGVFLLATLASWTDLGSQIDNDAYDAFFRLHRPASWVPQSAVLAIDEASLAATGGIYGLRSALAEALERAAAAKPKAMAIDIILHDAPNEADNARLDKALAATPNLVLASALLPRGEAWEDPLPRFRRHAVAVGHVHGQPDELDSVSREVALEKAAGRERRWALALEAFRISRGGSIPESPLESPRDLVLGGVVIPASRRDGRSLRIRFRPPQFDPIPTVSLLELRRDPSALDKLRDKTVFVGVTAQTAARDRPMTPYSSGMVMPGVEVHAHIFETLAQRLFLAPARDGAVLLITASLAALLGAIFWFLSGWPAYLASAAVLAVAHVLPYALFTRGVVFPFAPTVSTAWMTAAAAAVFQHFVVRRYWRRAEEEKTRYQHAMHFVTHEMRTPLTAIQGSSELMSRYPLTEEKRKQIAELINSESKRLGRMISTFLTVERLSAGQMELRRETFPASEVVSACVERARPLAERKQICMETRDLPAVLLSGDRELMEYAVYNLLTNAIKYSPKDSLVRVYGRLDGEMLRIAVEDQGIGMNQKEVRAVFQKFYRTRKAEESGETGTGIGLSIVQEIVRQHGGSIEVASHPGAGSCFTLVLPAAVSAAVSDRA
jgi:signal transduction histidine kinase